MNQKQQELYEKLLKKVNEYCLGQAAEDVIAAIDDLVDNYEKPKKRITKTKDQLLVENECYQYMLHQVRYYVESKEFSLEDIVKRLSALEIIKKFAVIDNGEIYICPDGIVTIDDKPIITIRDSKQEYELLKETLK